MSLPPVGPGGGPLLPCRLWLPGGQSNPGPGGGLTRAVPKSSRNGMGITSSLPARAHAPQRRGCMTAVLAVRPERANPSLCSLQACAVPEVERTPRQVQDTATTKAGQSRYRYQRGVTCMTIDVFCACRQGGKGHHSTQTPPPGKKQHRQPTAQHSTAWRRTIGHRRAKQTETAPQNDSRA